MRTRRQVFIRVLLRRLCISTEKQWINTCSMSFFLNQWSRDEFVIWLLYNFSCPFKNAYPKSKNGLASVIAFLISPLGYFLLYMVFHMRFHRHKWLLSSPFVTWWGKKATWDFLWCDSVYTEPHKHGSSAEPWRLWLNGFSCHRWLLTEASGLFERAQFVSANQSQAD